MQQEIFIGIVPACGSRDPTWTGIFEFDPVKGYSGKLLSAWRPKEGNLSFSLPDELNKEVVPCIIDGAEFGTILWPHFSGQRVKNLASMIIDARIPALVRRAHINENEASIKTIILHSPVFALMFGMKGVVETIERAPNRITIKSQSADEIAFKTTFGSLLFGLSQTYRTSFGGLSASIDSIGTLKITLSAAR
jgi:hypothetical protein